MTTTEVLQVQISAEDTVSMVAEQGTQGFTFRSVPSLNDAVISTTNPMPVRQVPTASTGIYSGATITGTSTNILAADTVTVFLELINLSSTDTIYIGFGVPAVIGAAGMIPLPPGWSHTWEINAIPADAINAISTGTSTPLTIGVK